MSCEERIAAAVRAARASTTDAERDAYEREGISVWRQIALDTGLDGVFTDRALRDASELGADEVTLIDLNTPRLDSKSTWALIAEALNDLRIGVFRTTAGAAIINAARSMAKGQGSWLVEDLTRQGVDPRSDRREAFYLSVVGFAAVYEATSECSLLTALAFAVTEYGAGAAMLDIPLDPEMLRRRINPSTTRGNEEDDLAQHYRRMLREGRKNGVRAAEKTRLRIVANNATISGKTSP